MFKPNLMRTGFCIALVCLVGCSKKETSAPAPETASYPASVEPQHQSSTGADPRLAPVQPSAPNSPTPVANPVVVPAGSDISAVLAQLTQAVRRYGAEKQRVPTSLNEVLGAGYVQGTPQPPTGKKFAIDPKRLEVMLVNQ